jgi:heat shock protein HtpX
MNRIFLFIGTNIAILVVLSLVMQLLGIESLLNEQGTQLDLRSLLIFSAVIGFVGSFISLAISKWSAKRLTGARVIKVPQNATESWLLNTVQRQAQVAEIGMPEVAIYDAPDVNAFPPAFCWFQKATYVASSY